MNSKELLLKYDNLKKNGATAYETYCVAISNGIKRDDCIGLIMTLHNLSSAQAREISYRHTDETKHKDVILEYRKYKDQGLSAEEVLTTAIKKGCKRSICIILLKILFDIERDDAHALIVKCNR